MSEKDVIYSKINIVKNCLMAIEKAQAKEQDIDFRQNIFEINLQRAIQACIDMANVIIAKDGLGLPNSYKQSFEILAKHNVISSDLNSIMSKMVGFRNISIHDYEVIKPQIVDKIVQDHLIDFEKFYSVIFNHTQNWT